MHSGIGHLQARFKELAGSKATHQEYGLSKTVSYNQSRQRYLLNLDIFSHRVIISHPLEFDSVDLLSDKFLDGRYQRFKDLVDRITKKVSVLAGRSP